MLCVLGAEPGTPARALRRSHAILVLSNKSRELSLPRPCDQWQLGGKAARLPTEGAGAEGGTLGRNGWSKKYRNYIGSINFVSKRYRHALVHAVFRIVELELDAVVVLQSYNPRIRIELFGIVLGNREKYSTATCL